MQFLNFEIKNFRGIDSLILDLNFTPKSKVYTLVGLNESGKTTILEAINWCSPNQDKSLDPLALPGYNITDPNTLIPISKRSNFNGEISCEATILPSPEDLAKIHKFVDENLHFKLTGQIGSFKVKRKKVFKDSRLTEEKYENFWTINLMGRKTGSRTTVKLEGDDWLKTATYIRSLIPSIFYFPNFLFEFPDKIYLEEVESETEKHAFYRLVVQDILDSLNNNLKVGKHIVDRAQSGEANDRKNLNNLLLEMGRQVTTTVFDAWNRIFRHKIGSKRITFTCDLDSNKKCYLEFRLEDSDGIYQINERSLGFRWFFVFLLLTQYRGFRKDDQRPIWFLFDEPASNLHPSAQGQLLESFKALAPKCQIMYTTHSHHLINPEWLEGTFVIKNEGLDNSGDELDYSAKKTKIKAHKYREFTVRYPHQTNYYRPILDVLDYAPSRLDSLPNAFFVEGKNDYYVLAYIQNLILKRNKPLNLTPGTGSGNMDSLVQLYIGWGLDFCILLDSDNAGTRERNRYVSKFGSLVDNRIFTYEDVSPDWKEITTEQLFSEVERIEIQKIAFPSESQFNKVLFNRAIQECLATKRTIKLADATAGAFNKLFDFGDVKFAEYANNRK